MKNKRTLGIIAAMVMLFCMIPASTFAANDDGDTEIAKRTVLVYICGTDLESNHGMASHNLRQILKAKFSKDNDVKVIVMTGGSLLWHLEEDCLSFPAEAVLPEDAVVNDSGETLDPRSQISNCYNQIWEARGVDAIRDSAPDPNAGKLVLLDGDGITDTSSVRSESELMTDPETLKAFINYGAALYPAEKYDPMGSRRRIDRRIRRR